MRQQDWLVGRPSLKLTAVLDHGRADGGDARIRTDRRKDGALSFRPHLLGHLEP